MAGKGSKRRKENFKAIYDHWDDINWGKKPKNNKKLKKEIKTS